jgi:hypothetical protein
MSITASNSLTQAHKGCFAIADRASAVLANLEGTGATLSYGDLAAAIGLDMKGLGKLDGYLVFLSLDSALDYRGWKNVADKGEVSKFVLKPITKVVTKRA